MVFSAITGRGILDILANKGESETDGNLRTGKPTGVDGAVGDIGPATDLGKMLPGNKKPNSKGLTYPLAVRGKNIGGPAAHGARAFGNWQSDNAVDIGVPMGTNVYAVADGRIIRLGGSWSGGSGNPDGFNVTIVTKDNEWFYTHLKSRSPKLRVGGKVVAGQYLGESGAGNGVPHLHIGSRRGNPEQLLGV